MYLRIPIYVLNFLLDSLLSKIVKFNLQVDDEIAKLKALKAELGSSGQNWAMDKKLSGSKEGPKPSPASQTAPPVQDPRVKEQGDLVRRLKSAKVQVAETSLLIKVIS